MAYLIQPDYVTYACTCGKLKPITQLYFCKHCLKIRCGFCICHEVDSHFCSNCLQNMPSSEASLKKNKCSSCFDCPSCFHTLSTRTTTAPRAVSTESPADGKVPPKKFYYLSCFNCRWTSRDVGLPDATVASGGWPERENVHQARVAALVEHYKGLAMNEKTIKERSRFAHSRGKYATLTDKIGLTGAAARSLAGLPLAQSSPATAPQGQTGPLPTHEAIDDLPADIFTAQVNLKKVTNIAQRLRAPWWQPTDVSNLHPCPRHLVVKRSQRCRECDHNLTKPEFNTGSIKFKIELLAYYHVPEIRIISWVDRGEESPHLVLRITNPTIHDITVTLHPDERPDHLKGDFTLAVLDSECSIDVPARDDAAEYDEPPQDTKLPSYVLWRKANKMAVKMSLKIEENKGDTRKLCCVRLVYTYRAGLASSNNSITVSELTARSQIWLPKL